MSKEDLPDTSPWGVYRRDKQGSIIRDEQRGKKPVKKTKRSQRDRRKTRRESWHQSQGRSFSKRKQSVLSTTAEIR